MIRTKMFAMLILASLLVPVTALCAESKVCRGVTSTLVVDGRTVVIAIAGDPLVDLREGVCAEGARRADSPRKATNWNQAVGFLTADLNRFGITYVGVHDETILIIDEAVCVGGVSPHESCPTPLGADWIRSTVENAQTGKVINACGVMVVPYDHDHSKCWRRISAP